MLETANAALPPCNGDDHFDVSEQMILPKPNSHLWAMHHVVDIWSMHVITAIPKTSRSG